MRTSCLDQGAASVAHLHVAPVDVHAADHAALRGDIRPVDHLLPIVEIQSHGVVQPLGGREKCWNGAGSQALHKDQPQPQQPVPAAENLKYTYSTYGGAASTWACYQRAPAYSQQERLLLQDLPPACKPRAQTPRLAGLVPRSERLGPSPALNPGHEGLGPPPAPA